jgi:hypothetical protein
MPAPLPLISCSCGEPGFFATRKFECCSGLYHGVTKGTEEVIEK